MPLPILSLPRARMRVRRPTSLPPVRARRHGGLPPLGLIMASPPETVWAGRKRIRPARGYGGGCACLYLFRVVAGSQAVRRRACSRVGGMRRAPAADWRETGRAENLLLT